MRRLKDRKVKELRTKRILPLITFGLIFISISMSTGFQPFFEIRDNNNNIPLQLRTSNGFEYIHFLNPAPDDEIIKGSLFNITVRLNHTDSMFLIDYCKIKIYNSSNLNDILIDWTNMNFTVLAPVPKNASFTLNTSEIIAGSYNISVSININIGVYHNETITATFTESAPDDTPDPSIPENNLDYLLWLLLILTPIIFSILLMGFIITRKRRKVKLNEEKEILVKIEKSINLGKKIIPDRFLEPLNKVKSIVSEAMNAGRGLKYLSAINLLNIALNEMNEIKAHAKVNSAINKKFIDSINGEIAKLNRKREDYWRVEQIIKVRCFNDIKSINKIILMLKTSGLPLGHSDYQLGDLLEESLVSGFLSGITSFAKELVLQMNKTETNEKKENIVDFNQLKITMLDGELTKLVIISEKEISKAMIDRMYAVLNDFETAHHETIAGFNGGVSQFDVFPSYVDEKLGMGLRRRSKIDNLRLDKLAQSEDFKFSSLIISPLIRISINEKSIIPIDLPEMIMELMNISLVDAKYHVFMAYLNKCFITIKDEDIEKSKGFKDN